MEERFLTPTKWRRSKLDEFLPMSFISTRPLHESTDLLEMELGNIKEEIEIDSIWGDEFEETNETSETKCTVDQCSKIEDTNLAQIVKNSNRNDPQTSLCVNTSIASQSRDCQSTHTNTDSGYSATMSGMSESLLNGNDQICIHPRVIIECIHPEVGGECKLSASPRSLCESWEGGIQTTSTPFTAPKFASDDQNVYKIAKGSTKILQFGNEPSQENQDPFLDKKDEATNSGNSSSCLRASANAGREKLDVVNEIISTKRQNDDTAARPFNVTYNVVKKSEAWNQQHSAAHCIKKSDEQEGGCSSKMVQLPPPEKVLKTTADKNRETSRKSRVLTSQGRRRSGKYVSLAEALLKYQTATPKRYRTMPNGSRQLIASKQYKDKERKSTKGQPSGSSNEKRAAPKTEAELKLRVGKDNAAAAGCSSTKKNIASPATSGSDERNKRALKKRKELTKQLGETGAQTFVFRAKPMPNFRSPKVAKSRKPLTDPLSPSWARRKK